MFQLLQQEVNLAAVLVAAVAHLILGMLWWSPLLFGKQWMDLMGFKKKDMEAKKREVRKAHLVSFISALVAAYVLALIIGVLVITDPVEGAVVGAIMWLGFTATVTKTGMMYSGKKHSLWAIDTGYWALIFAVMGAILAVWK